MDLARTPCLTAFHRLRALPSGVRGPVERWALRRLAVSCMLDMGLRLLMRCTS